MEVVLPTHLPTQYPWEWVSDAAGLRRAAEAVAAAERIYLDLEADSMHHYYAKICLMQILAGHTCYVVDPLAGLDLQPLLRALADKPLVLHGADYDLRMLYSQFEFRPLQVFDTMLAAQLLGRTAFGLAALVLEQFGVVIEKESQKADWSLRPLPPHMLEYAAQDTAFLPGLHQSQTRELVEKGRLEWHRESCGALVTATAKIREIDPDSAWRISGSSPLKSRQLAALKALWEVREKISQARDLPGYKILPSEVLLRFAEAVPREGQPETIPRLPSRLSPEARESFLQAYATALQQPRENWPQPKPPNRPPLASPNPELLAAVREVRDRLAADLHLDPSLLAPKAMMLAVALTGLSHAETARKSAQWMQWQENLLLEPWLRAAERFQPRR